jgi:hypothetical protein
LSTIDLLRQDKNPQCKKYRRATPKVLQI